MQYEVKDYHVKELADFYGVSPQAIRLYGKKGLLLPSQMEENGYRSYNRDEFLTMDLILRLRSMEFSLEEARKILHGEPLTGVNARVLRQQDEVRAQIVRLQAALSYLDNYQSRLDAFLRAREHSGAGQTPVIELAVSPPVILREISADMEREMAAFRALDPTRLPVLTLETNREELLVNLMRPHGVTEQLSSRENRQFDYKLSLTDEAGLRFRENFPAEQFRVVEPTLCLHAYACVSANRDYREMDMLYDYVREAGLEFTGNSLFLWLSTCYCSSAYLNYGEIWAPVQKR